MRTHTLSRTHTDGTTCVDGPFSYFVYYLDQGSYASSSVAVSQKCQQLVHGPGESNSYDFGGADSQLSFCRYEIAKITKPRGRTSP